MSFQQSAQHPRPSAALERDLVTLSVCQQPHLALVTAESKEKTRKAIDPPPVVQLKVDETRSHENRRHWMVSPFIFMTVLLVEKDADPRSGLYNPVAGNKLLGQTVSSLHRLKDMRNQEGGYFVFGDISCRTTGRYRLQFNLFDFENAEAVFVASQVSDPFHVVNPKDFHGQKESTALSRSFSEQGVRLRLRKEHRTLAGSKRGFNDSPDQSSAPPVTYGINNNPQADRSSFDFNASKRARPEEYNQQLYYASQVPNNPLFQYGTGLQSSGYGLAGVAASSSAMDQSSSFGSLISSGYSMPNVSQSWSRPMQQGSLSAPLVGPSSNNPYLHNLQTTVPTTRNESTPNQQHRQSQVTPLRTPDDNMSGIGLHTPSSLPDSTHTSTSQQQQSYIDPHSHAATFSSGAPTYSIQQQPHETSDSHTQLDYRTGLSSQYLSNYQQSAMRPLSGGTYHQPMQDRSLNRYDPTHFGGSTGAGAVQNPYPSDSERSSYPSHLSTTDNNTALDSGVLNRGFLPPYAGQQAGVVGQQQHGEDYKDPPYPTPHQTSPLG